MTGTEAEEEQWWHEWLAATVELLVRPLIDSSKPIAKPDVEIATYKNADSPVSMTDLISKFGSPSKPPNGPVSMADFIKSFGNLSGPG